MKLRFVEEQNERPVEEQFSYIRGDVVGLLEATRKVEVSTRRLENNENNRANSNKTSVCSCRIRNLEETSDIRDIVTIKLGNIEKYGVIKDSDGNELVQWECVFVGKINAVNTIFFVNVKETPHANDIVFESTNRAKSKIDFNDKILKTNEFFSSILPLDDSKRSNQFKMQNDMLRRYLNSPRCYVYASVHMHPDIIQRFDKLNIIHDDKVSVHYAQCEHNGAFVLRNVASVSP